MSGIYDGFRHDELVRTVFSRKGAKNAKKIPFNISWFPLRALPFGSAQGREPDGIRELVEVVEGRLCARF